MCQAWSDAGDAPSDTRISIRLDGQRRKYRGLSDKAVEEEEKWEMEVAGEEVKIKTGEVTTAEQMVLGKFRVKRIIMMSLSFLQHPLRSLFQDSCLEAPPYSHNGSV